MGGIKGIEGASGGGADTSLGEGVEAVLDVVRRNVPGGYREGMNWGMIVWEVPLERYPDTYNGEPLGYLALAAQKRHYALYMNTVYADDAVRERLEAGFRDAGKTLDLGKSCLRFKKLDDLALDAVAEAVGAAEPDAYIALYEASRKA